ncbi:30S ribosomal protein S2 [Patescibacteria group bacterium]|nr:30S ribosomal protein S2 [Patescibacteria group bacterium]
MKEVSLLELLKSGVHFGHQAKNWHPKMKPYIFTMRGGIHIIDLEKTVPMLRQACSFVSGIVAKGGTVLFVTTKRQATEIVKQMADSVGMPSVTQRWIGGTLTNFDNITKLVRRLKDLREKRKSGALDKYTKREQLQFSEEIANLEKLVGGIESLDKLPNAIFMIDIKKDKTALREARKKKIPVVAMADTNVNVDLIDYPIPANDDATKSIKLITTIVAEAVKEGQSKQKLPPTTSDADKAATQETKTDTAAKEEEKNKKEEKK